MTNIKISERGRAFLKNGHAAVQVATAIATSDDSRLQSSEGLVVRIGNVSVTVRSAAAVNAEAVAV
jgi:hypothetical protein